MSSATPSNKLIGVSTKKTRTKHSKFERILILAVLSMGIILAFVNISFLTLTSIQEANDHHSVTKTHRNSGFRNASSAAVALGGIIANGNGDNNNAMKPKQSQSQPQSQSQSQPNQDHTGNTGDHSGNNKKESYVIDEKMMRILRHVGIQNATQLSEDDRKLLPTWDEVVENFGNDGPKILGLETCKAYAASIPKNMRLLGVAGPFNSGTHYLDEVLSKNCLYTNPNVKAKKNQNRGVMDQVPWGKHQSPRFRLIHSREISHSITQKNEADKKDGALDHPELPPHLEEINRSVLPVVMVRDPFTWWQSMCKSRYSAHWYHVVPDHCPNFVPNHVEKEWYHKKKPEIREHYDGDPWKMDNVMEKANFTLDKDVVPLWVRYHSENWQHKSLAHMWADWYKDYYDADYPRLMIRLEDLVFYPHETLRQVCECANGGSDDGTKAEDGYFEYIGDDNLVLSLESSIKGQGPGVDNLHGADRVGLLGAMTKHAGKKSISHRARGMTMEDLRFASDVLKDSETMSYFGYKPPLESHLEQ